MSYLDGIREFAERYNAAARAQVKAEREANRAETDRDRRCLSNKRFYAAHREAITAANRAKYAAHRDEILARHRAKYAAHRDEILARHRAWCAANPAKMAEYRRRSRETKKRSANHG